MEHAMVEFLKFMFSRTDPTLVFCLLLIVYWLQKTNKKIDKHIDKDNPSPHPVCELQRQAFRQVAENIDQYRKENREDHQEIFRILREAQA